MALEECYEELQVSVPESCHGTDSQHTPDHDYYRTQQTVPDYGSDHEEYTDVETIWIKREDKENNVNSGITNYILTDTEGDSVSIGFVFYLREAHMESKLSNLS